MDTELVRHVVRTLRYRPLPHLVGRAVEIADPGRVEEAVRLALGPDLPAGGRLTGSGVVKTDGPFELRFTAPAELLNEEARSGVPLLRDLGFLPGGEAGGSRVCDDPTCIEMLQDDLDEGRVWLLLLLSRTGYGGPAPRTFRIVDACVSNAAGVWLVRHPSG